MPFLRGLVVRVGLAALPLVVVLLLCFLMTGWLGRNPGPTPPAELTAHAAEVPAAERLTRPEVPKNQQVAVAQFQSQHILHARIHVPY